jgi:hypothetical protein
MNFWLPPSSIPPTDQHNQTLQYLLDPLTVIIKLAILGYKPIGTKLSIQNNTMYLQEPGPFQALCRYLGHANKSDLQYLYNPIYYACQHYLLPTSPKYNVRMTSLFKLAQIGLQRLGDTYSHCTVMQLCLNYYYAIIAHALDNGASTISIFYSDTMSHLYTGTFMETTMNQWDDNRINVVLNIIDFLDKEVCVESNVKSLELMSA